jgi:HAMP domain-containing protein
MEHHEDIHIKISAMQEEIDTLKQTVERLKLSL